MQRCRAVASFPAILARTSKKAAPEETQIGAPQHGFPGFCAPVRTSPQRGTLNNAQRGPQFGIFTSERNPPSSFEGPQLLLETLTEPRTEVRVCAQQTCATCTKHNYRDKEGTLTRDLPQSATWSSGNRTEFNFVGG